jgi:hypothetical protein
MCFMLAIIAFCCIALSCFISYLNPATLPKFVCYCVVKIFVKLTSKQASKERVAEQATGVGDCDSNKRHGIMSMLVEHQSNETTLECGKRIDAPKKQKGPWVSQLNGTYIGGLQMQKRPTRHPCGLEWHQSIDTEEAVNTLQGQLAAHAA